MLALILLMVLNLLYNTYNTYKDITRQNIMSINTKERIFRSMYKVDVSNNSPENVPDSAGAASAGGFTSLKDIFVWLNGVQKNPPKKFDDEISDFMSENNKCLYEELTKKINEMLNERDKKLAESIEQTMTLKEEEDKLKFIQEFKCESNDNIIDSIYNIFVESQNKVYLKMNELISKKSGDL